MTDFSTVLLQVFDQRRALLHRRMVHLYQPEQGAVPTFDWPPKGFLLVHTD